LFDFSPGRATDKQRENKGERKKKRNKGGGRKKGRRQKRDGDKKREEGRFTTLLPEG